MLELEQISETTGAAPDDASGASGYALLMQALAAELAEQKRLAASQACGRDDDGSDLGWADALLQD